MSRRAVSRQPCMSSTGPIARSIGPRHTTLPVPRSEGDFAQGRESKPAGNQAAPGDDALRDSPSAGRPSQLPRSPGSRSVSERNSRALSATSSRSARSALEPRG
jgi:hypothetical protein